MKNQSFGVEEPPVYLPPNPEPEPEPNPEPEPQPTKPQPETTA